MFWTKLRKRKDEITNKILKIPLPYINPNVLTAISLVCSLLAVYFLFVNHTLFIIFALVHLFIDTFDGVIARKFKLTSKFGYWFDNSTDNLFAILLFIKYVIISQNYLFFIFLALFVIYYILRLFSKSRPPLSFRTILSISFILKLYMLGMWYASFASVFSLAYIIYLIVKWEKSTL